mgnify:FL=1
MKKAVFYILLLAFVLSSCQRKQAASDEVEEVDVPEPTVVAEVVPEPEPEMPAVGADTESLRRWMNASKDSAAYAAGILPRMAEDAPKYCKRLLESTHRRFIVVDKRRMKAIVYDRTGRQEHIYGIACAKNYGTKREKGDCRTHEGFFTARGVYDSSEWLYTDVFGYTSPEKGQYGPRFICLQTLGGQALGIGIHGTNASWSIGGRRSHGCIRVTNDDIMDLIQYVDSGMPVIVSPGKLDMISNAQAGLKVPAVVTDGSKTIVLSEKDLNREIRYIETLPHDAKPAADSVKATPADEQAAPTAADEPKPKPKPEPKPESEPESEPISTFLTD